MVGESGQYRGYLHTLSNRTSGSWIPGGKAITGGCFLFVSDDLSEILYGLKTPVAIQAATAVANGATAFATKDIAFKRLNQLEVVILDDLL